VLQPQCKPTKTPTTTAPAVTVTADVQG
jgi:hypothetical protein